MKLYRYRTIKSALLELDNGTFYFAEPKELNDPLEGYLKIFWRGDKFAWEGLLKNFVCSLFYNLQTYLLMSRRFQNAKQENFLSDFHNKSILPDLHQFENSPFNRIFAELSEKFWSEEIVKEVVEFYGDDKIKCYGREMEFIFRTVIDAAFIICLKKCKNLGWIHEDFDEKFFDVGYEISFAELKNISDVARKEKIDAIENLNCDMMESGLLGLKLSNRSFDMRYMLKRHMIWLRFIFPRTYVEQLKEIMYPNGYVVCFSDTPTNSAMWGNYADNHRGICFIYETENFDGRECITFTAKSLEVKPIKYTSQVIERNFFDTLRNLKFIHAEDWLTGRGGLKSKKLIAPESAKEYVDDYQEKFYRKIMDWNHEREYRIFLADRFYHYSDKFARKLKYDLKTLTGIIFGIRTTLDDKLKILQKLARLGKSTRNFKFFQAEYDDETQLISIREKILLTKII
ncbi:MAG: DUF2971 domain-containing protein [Selenomonadaceae bacterium]|nr:DUF2971 domain-containing protein [Selenomonadaceae bacterium]